MYAKNLSYVVLGLSIIDLVVEFLVFLFNPQSIITGVMDFSGTYHTMFQFLDISLMIDVFLLGVIFTVIVKEFPSGQLPKQLYLLSVLFFLAFVDIMIFGLTYFNSQGTILIGDGLSLLDIPFVIILLTTRPSNLPLKRIKWVFIIGILIPYIYTAIAYIVRYIPVLSSLILYDGLVITDMAIVMYLIISHLVIQMDRLLELEATIIGKDYPEPNLDNIGLSL